jgi:SAM-dependent methyltransferase
MANWSDQTQLWGVIFMERAALTQKLSEYNFYQKIDLGDGVTTPGGRLGPKQKQVLNLINSLDLHGKRVVDLGCANGLFALAAEARGAAEVIAVDHTRQNIEALNEVILPHLGSSVKAIQANVMDFTPDRHGQFDLVIFAGLLYHLRYPFSALKIVKDLVRDGGVIILETGMLEDFNHNALLFCPSPKDSPQRTRGGNSCTFFNEKALVETLAYFGIKVRSRVVATGPARRLVKKVLGSAIGSYRISNIVLLCERDCSMEDESLIRFYESTTQ